MAKKTRGVVALVALCGLSLFLLNCGSTVSRSSGLLYVLSQGSSDVESYAINLTSGNLSLINSNAKTDNMPSSIILDPTGAVAFVLNAGSNDITAYTINKDGSLSEASGNTAITVQNSVAMARDAEGKFLFVVSQGSIPLPQPTPGNPDNQCGLPGQLNILLEPNTVCPHVSVFAIQPGSTTLTAVGNPFPLGQVPTAVAVTTITTSGGATGTLLYVANNIDLKNLSDNTVSEFVFDGSGSGTLTQPPGSPYTTASNPSAVIAVATSPIGGSGGLFVYVTNGTTNSVSAYQVCTVENADCSNQDVTNLKLLPVGTPANAGSNPVAMVVDPLRQFLYVASKNSSQVFGFRINATQGTLGALSPANMSTGSQPVALAMHSSGKFLFVSNSASSNISAFTVDTTSGAMSSPITITSSAQPAGLASK